MRKIIILLGLVAGFGGTALASEKCNVAMADWQPREALQTKLEGDGWKVRSIKTEDGCYEAYAINAEGKKVEAYFNPQTFQPVDMKIED
ncbi:MAG: PepSY domain-containing protein [Rhizobium sp.]|nr:PepSY domain-containing protein [Rhizobium sp.]